MKVCAHYNYGPFAHEHERYHSIADALYGFTLLLAVVGVDTGDGEHYTIDLYPQCSECDSQMNFHDYPMTRYQLGPRGGLARQYV
jgi:hypothetical protein